MVCHCAALAGAVGEVPVADICPTIYSPVCDTNGVTQSNDCVAAAAGAEVACQGECPCEGTAALESCACAHACSACECMVILQGTHPLGPCLLHAVLCMGAASCSLPLRCRWQPGGTCGHGLPAD